MVMKQIKKYYYDEEGFPQKLLNAKKDSCFKKMISLLIRNKCITAIQKTK
jgi:hypothetical protein